MTILKNSEQWSLPELLAKTLLRLSVISFLYVLGSAGIWKAMMAAVIGIVPFLFVVAGAWYIAPAVYEFIATYGDDEEGDDETEARVAA